MTRGDICRVRLPAGRRHEQRGPRYAVVIQADEFHWLSTAIVAPTSRGAAAATFRPELVIRGAATRIMVEQSRAVDVQRLDEPLGRLGPTEQRAVDDALELVLGL